MQPPLDKWRNLIDWYGGLVERGGLVAVQAGTLVVRGPHWLLTPPITAALRPLHTGGPYYPNVLAPHPADHGRPAPA